jgi:hypothetical protein
VTTKRTRRREQTFEILKLLMLVMNRQQKMAAFVADARRNKKTAINGTVVYTSVVG